MSTDATKYRDTMLVGIIGQIDTWLRWLQAWTIHHADHLRDSRNGLKIGDHQAPFASIATIMAALYLRRTRRKAGCEAACRPDA